MNSTDPRYIDPVTPPVGHRPPDGATQMAIIDEKLDAIIALLGPVSEIFDALKTHPMLKAFIQ